MGTAIILFAHGSRDPEWAAPFRAIKARVEAARPDVRVELAFLELMQPTLTDAAKDVAATCNRVIVAPLFMGQGAHLKRDVSGLLGDLRNSHPDVQFDLLPGVGEMEMVIDAISASVARAAMQMPTS